MYHETTSKVNQQNDEGINYKILENGTILWNFYHNFYTPSQYEDFHFILNKPKEWEFISVLDPTLQSRPFQGGCSGDNILTINKTHAVFPGWWRFTATSPNYLNLTNTNIWKQGETVESLFVSGESIAIKTQLNNSDNIPPNLDDTPANLTIYYPNGTIFYEESKLPDIGGNGNITFSIIEFSSANTIGGLYNYTIIWSNGTALGGIKSNFIVRHNASLVLQEPYDAVSTYSTEAMVGDIIPLNVYLNDTEKDIIIVGAKITYN